MSSLSLEHDLIMSKSASTAPPATAPTAFGESQSLDDSVQYVMNLIHSDQVNPAQAKQIMKEVVQAWTDHVNPGFLQYRKSVAEDFASVEWRDGTPGGSTVIDIHGKEYIDCLGGYGIYNVGHSHPVVVEAVKKQMEKQSLHSQELLDPLRAYCAAILAKTMPGDLQYSFFTNSGTESVEACLKMAMLSTGRRHFIGVVGAFHGKSLGSLSGTSKSVFRKPFQGGLIPFNHIPVNDCEALRRAFESAKFTGNEIAGFLVEPVLGEGGIHVCSDEFLRTARQLCDEHGSMLIFDEVQSGMGRTGKMWACEWADVAPDLMAIGKAFGGGVTAAGACVGNYKAWHKYFENPFLHTTTFGGSPVAMAAAVSTFHVLQKENLVEAARIKGHWLKAQLHGLQEEYPHILKIIRGRGLMIGLEFPGDDVGYTFSKGVFSRGVLLAGTLINSRVIRVEPPLTITQLELETVISRFRDTLESMCAVYPHPARQACVKQICAGPLPTIQEEGQASEVPQKEPSQPAPLRERGVSQLSEEEETDVSDCSGSDEESECVSIASISTSTSSLNPKARRVVMPRKPARLTKGVLSPPLSSNPGPAGFLGRNRGDSVDTEAAGLTEAADASSSIGSSDGEVSEGDNDPRHPKRRAVAAPL